MGDLIIIIIIRNGAKNNKYVIKMIKNLQRYDNYVRSSSRFVILNNRPMCVWHPLIFATCLLWKCRYRVYWNLWYSWSILKVIFLKNNLFCFIETLQIKMTLWESGRNPPWYRKCWPKLLLSKRFIFSHFCDMKS